MSNDVKPTPTRGVAVQLDKQRFLRFPLSVLKSLQKQKDGEERSLGDILLMGLKADDPSLTLEQIDEMIDLENIKELFGPVKKATGGLIDLSKVFKGMDDADPQTPSPATGQSSAAS